MFDPLTSFGQLNDLKKTAQNTPKCGRNIRWHAFTGTLFNSDTEACIPIITFHFETSAPIKYKYMGSLCKIWKKWPIFCNSFYSLSQILGLCMGFSFVSLAEIVYHCFLCIVLLFRKKRALFKKKQAQKNRRKNASILENSYQLDNPGKPLFFFVTDVTHSWASAGPNCIIRRLCHSPMISMSL